MEAEIIAVGSEMLTPGRIDTNSLWLTERLNRRGIELARKCVIGDDRARLTLELRRAREASQVVIVTGGLGPTLDDLTRECAAEATGRELVFREEVVGWIAQRFASLGRTMTENNKRQAFLLSGAELLPNPNGTAPGQYLQDDQGVLMLLPGPPRELKPLFVSECEPRLDKLPSPWQYYTSSLRISGLGESDVDQRIGPIYSAEERASTTILAAPSDIQLHIRGRAKTEAEARVIAEAVAAKVRGELGDHVYSDTDEPLEVVVGSLLRERGLLLGLAESCTGGLLAERITDVPGSSDYFVGAFVSYRVEAKARWLGVPSAVLEEFGPVSEQVTAEMAARARDAAGGARKAIGAAITGIAGPAGGTDETPVGTVFLSVADEAGVLVKKHKFNGDRERVRALAAQLTLELIRRRLLGLP
ncbi:MAG: competence/damage-inducible protein A [Acidobacteria bacterium]|nr:competence/damage-inducible protein A [Acidobacteriota bacterium]MDA1235011.1 competence/damage-inducible protein A [Acidobacteriota bacterium]